CQQNSNWPLTC
nr:immunoglobulin light chain junction region [Macaca mulatta]